MTALNKNGVEKDALLFLGVSLTGWVTSVSSPETIVHVVLLSYSEPSHHAVRNPSHMERPTECNY